MVGIGVSSFHFIFINSTIIIEFFLIEFFDCCIVDINFIGEIWDSVIFKASYSTICCVGFFTIFNGDDWGNFFTRNNCEPNPTDYLIIFSVFSNDDTVSISATSNHFCFFNFGFCRIIDIASFNCCVIDVDFISEIWDSIICE